MELKNVIDAWTKIIFLLKSNFEDEIFFKNYFLKIEVFKIKNNDIFFKCPNFVVKKICENDLKKKIENNFLDIFNLNFNCYFFVKNEETEIKNEKENNFLNKDLTFDSYVIGDFNEQISNLKKKIILNLTELSPVFIYGKTGLGKTHAINALGNYIKKNDSDKKILFLNTEDFLNDAYKSISNNRVEEFKESFYGLDVLIVDDIQFFSKKNNLNKIFFTIFNKLQNNFKMIILASDKKPIDLDIDKRMTSRFQSGITINIKKPDDFSIKKIINLYEKKYFFSLSNDASEFLSNRFNEDIRLLIGVIKKIVLNIDVKEVITRKKIEKILNDEINLGLIKSGYKVSPEIIIQNVCIYYQVSFNDVISKSRKKEVKDARAICIYILRNELHLSYNEIGIIFSNRSHSTVMSAYKMLKNQIEKNTELAEFVEKIIKKI